MQPDDLSQPTIQSHGRHRKPRYAGRHQRQWMWEDHPVRAAVTVTAALIGYPAAVLIIAVILKYGFGIHHIP